MYRKQKLAKKTNEKSFQSYCSLWYSTKAVNAIYAEYLVCWPFFEGKEISVLCEKGRVER